MGKREKEGRREKGRLRKRSDGKDPPLWQPPELPSRQMLQHSAGGIQLLRVGGDLSGLQGGIYETKLKSKIDHLIYSRSSADYFS